MRAKQLRIAANRWLGRWTGLKLRRASAPTRYWAEGFENMKRFGFRAQTIIDVGVCDGTPELYDAFPDARLYLFEPNPASEPLMRRLVKERPGSLWCSAAVGDQARDVEFWVRPDDPGASSLASHGGTEQKIQTKMLRLDDVLQKNDIVHPAILKIDVEGFELDVIKGCAELLAEIDVIIMETWFYPCQGKPYEFADVVGRLQALGFVVYDILDGVYRPHDGVLGCVDLVFVRDEGLLRKSFYRDVWW